MKTIRTPHRRGFTLVELLVVITIIGALAGLAIPAISAVMRNVSVAAMKAEMTNIETGISDYQTKYGDYPPDFFDWSIAKRHYLKIFPDIAASELILLQRLCDTVADNAANQLTATHPHDPTKLDRAEALVWSLGGFSSDPQFPFTGSGGPLVYFGPAGSEADPSLYEYNPIRNAPQVEFETKRLSIVPPRRHQHRQVVHQPNGERRRNRCRFAERRVPRVPVTRGIESRRLLRLTNLRRFGSRAKYDSRVQRLCPHAGVGSI